MNVLVKDLQVLSVVENEEKEYSFDSNNIVVVAKHISYLCFSKVDNSTVKVRDFKNLLDWKVGDIVSHNFNIPIKNLKLDIK